MHADFYHQSTLLVGAQAQGFGEESASGHGCQYQHGDAEAQAAELAGDGGMVLHKKDGGQEDEGGKGYATQNAVDAGSCRGTETAHGQSGQDGQEHEHEVLHDEATHGQVYGGVGSAEITHGKIHDEGNGEKGEDATASGERYRKSHIALGQHGEHIAGAAAGRTGYEHDTDEINGFEAESDA